MQYQTPHIDKKYFFSLVGLFFIGLVLFSTILAIFGLFYIPLIYAYITIGLAILAHIFLKNKLYLKISSYFGVVLFISAGFILLFSFYSTPTVFSGRDQGAYSEAATRLFQNHKLTFSIPASEEFFKIYGPGKALNFPGFNYTKEGKLITQFPIGYISWLAVFYSMFGLSGFVVANAVSFFVFLVSFYSLSKNYLKNISAFIALLLILASFVFSWFFKFSLSENLALGIIFFGLCQLVFFLKNSQKIHLFCAIFSFLVLLFIKTEAILFLASGIFAVYWLSKKRKKEFPSIGKKAAVFFLLIFLLYFFNLLFLETNYYRTIGKALLHAILGKSSEISESSNLLFESIYTFRILSIYSLLTFVVLGIIGFLYLIFKKRYAEIVPFLVLLPSFFYLLQPSISDDHPWMLRRFVFSVVPICILYSVVFLESLFKEKKCVLSLLLFLLLFSELPIFIFYLSISENNNLLSQIQKISTNFKNNDLVFVDQMSTGNGFSMMAGTMNFLYGKQAVYFINPTDIDKINLSRFNQVYFVIPDDNLNMYQESGLIKRLSPIKDYVIETTGLDTKTGKKADLCSQPVELPIEQRTIVYGKIYQLK